MSRHPTLLPTPVSGKCQINCVRMDLYRCGLTKYMILSSINVPWIDNTCLKRHVKTIYTCNEHIIKIVCQITFTVFLVNDVKTNDINISIWVLCIHYVSITFAGIMRFADLSWFSTVVHGGVHVK